MGFPIGSRFDCLDLWGGGFTGLPGVYVRAVAFVDVPKEVDARAEVGEAVCEIATPGEGLAACHVEYM